VTVEAERFVYETWLCSNASSWHEPIKPCFIYGVMPRLLFILQLFIKYLSFYLHITIIRIIFVE
jgi:hypothetical protein